MRKAIIGLIVVAAVIFGVAVFQHSSQPAAPQLTFATVSSDIKTNAKLYDVRTPEEFASGHFAGATNFSLQDMQAGQLPNVPKNEKIYLYCHSGNRAGQATQILRAAGYTNVVDLGGLTDVQAMGGKLIQ